MPTDGSWLDLKIKPANANVYVNGSYVGTVQQFTSPFRPLRIGLGHQRIEFRAPGYETASFWLTQERHKVSVLTGTLSPK